MRILIISQWFDPEPTFKGLAFAQKLVGLGHTVEVLTGFPNYPGGTLYEGYRVKFFQREVINGIPISRVPLFPSHDRSAVKRIANYVSFATSAALFGRFTTEKPDIIYAYHPPATIGLPAAILSWLYRAPLVYDIQDLWPDTLAATEMLNNDIALAMIDRWCRWVYRRADKLVVLSPGFRRRLLDKGIDARKIELIYNWCDESVIKPAAMDEDLAAQLGLKGKFNILFAGSMGKAQGLEAVLNAAALVADRYPMIQFVFIGGGICVADLKCKVRMMGIRNVIFLTRRPYREISTILNMADVLLVHLKDDPLFEITIPSKTQAYMAVGKPILMGVMGDAANLVEKASAGVTCTPEDPADIADAAVKLYQMPREKLKTMGKNGLEFYLHELSIDVGAKKFDHIFKAMVLSKLSNR